MNGLKVIENNLVPVYETSTGEKVVYGSELYAILEVKSNYRDWIRNRFADIEAIENEDFEAAKFSAFRSDQKRPHHQDLIPPKKWPCLSETKKESRCGSTLSP